jgi:phosphoglycerate dehydrogenase-like enzyme
MATNQFRIGLSSAFTRTDGKPTFPSCDWSGLSGMAGVEMDELPRGAEELTSSILEGYDAVVLMSEFVRADSFPANGRLKVIARMGVGFDRIDVPACTENDVALVTTPDGVRRPMASSIIAMVLALSHRLIEKDRVTRTGKLGWAARLDCIGTGLVGRTMASIGIGNIGGEMFRLLKPFEMRLVAHDPYADPARAAELGVELVGLHEAFEQADFLAFNCPLNDGTRGIGGKDNIARMKPSAYLINTSRGPVVDQSALYDALVQGRLAGAAIDVFDPEPPSADEPILKLSNVIVTPHAIGFQDQMWSVMGEVNTDAITAVIEGRNPGNVVNRDVLDRPSWSAKIGG